MRSSTRPRPFNRRLLLSGAAILVSISALSGLTPATGAEDATASTAVVEPEMSDDTRAYAEYNGVTLATAEEYMALQDDTEDIMAELSVDPRVTSARISLDPDWSLTIGLRSLDDKEDVAGTLPDSLRPVVQFDQGRYSEAELAVAAPEALTDAIEYGWDVSYVSADVSEESISVVLRSDPSLGDSAVDTFIHEGELLTGSHEG